MEKKTFTIRRALAEDLPEMIRLMNEVKAGMEHPEWYVTDHRERMERHIEAEGFILVAECEEDGKMAGFFMVDLPGVHSFDPEDELDENLGEALFLDEKELCLVAHMDSAAVRPEYRGHHLQGRLLAAAERELEHRPQIYFLCTVHPYNQASLTTMRRHGYVVIARKEKYGGLERYILYKKKEAAAPETPRILVSACLLGVRCRYHGDGVLEEELQRLMEEAQLIPFCPEISGGLATPREPAEILEGRVVTKSGVDVTKEYRRGAEEALYLARLFGCSCAILKERSPSCGSGRIYDGTHSGKLTYGDGVTAAVLKKNGIPVFGESQIKECRTFFFGSGKKDL